MTGWNSISFCDGPSNVGRSWSKDEQNSIVEAFQNGEPVKSIAARQAPPCEQLRLDYKDQGY